MIEILRLTHPEDQIKLAEEAAKQNLSSKAVRAKVNKLLGTGKPEKQKAEKQEAQPFHFQRKDQMVAIRGAYVPSEKTPQDYLAEFSSAFMQFLSQAPKEQPLAASPTEPHDIPADPQAVAA